MNTFGKCLAVLMFVSGCGSSGSPNTGDGSNDPQGTGLTGAGGGTQASGGAGGTSISAECSVYSTCFEQCYCETSDSSSCASQCAQTPPGGGTPAPTPTSPAPAPAPTTTAPAPTPTSTAPAPTSTSTAPAPTTTATAPADMPPATNEVQLITDSFEVPPGGEVYKCQNFTNPFGADVDIIYSESFMAPMSHHMFAFREQGLTDSGLMDCSGLEIAEYIHTAQTPEEIVTYPPGVGRFLPSTDGVRIQMHYLNTSPDPITAQVTLTLHYVDPTEVDAHAAALFLNNLGVRARPGESTSTKTYALPYDIKLIGAGSHMHSRGVGFLANVVGGPDLYTTTEWDEPEPVGFDPPIDIATGQQVQWACTYQNPTASTLTFGESAATNEMCIFVGTFYPAQGGNSIIVNSF